MTQTIAYLPDFITMTSGIARTHFINIREMRLSHSTGWQGGQGVNSGAIHNASNAVQRAL
jgi:hypothetical protein